MTLTTLIIYIGITAFLLTAVTGFVFKGHKSWLMTYLQNFTGALFVFSGYVKAVDPLGTAYKMEQYFTAFESTFEGTWMSFLAPLFPWMSEYVTSFSVIMIVFEIVLGLMLIMGYKSKLTSWLFLLLVAFFTVLTGFTYLTGYVPSGVNFFQFGSWTEYVATNMQVTDCGCFGDFLKLEPKVSFMKDIALMIPALYFVFKHKDMHELFTGKIRNIIVLVSTILVTIYCFNNFMWDIPKTDFRPFKKGIDVKAQRIAEEDAEAAVQIVAWELENIASGKVIELPNAQYMSNFKDYPKTEWKITDQIKTEPTIKPTKISEYEITAVNGDDMTYQLLEDPEYSIMIVSYKMYGDANKASRTIQDTTYTIDTLVSDNGVVDIVKSISEISSREETYYDYVWDQSFYNDYAETIVPLVKDARAAGIKSYTVVGGAGADMIDDFKGELGFEMPFYTADDILLKTIVRSNPGVVLWKDGVVVNKWHVDQLPSFADIKKENIN